MKSDKSNVFIRIILTILSLLIIIFIFSQSVLNAEISGEQSGRLLAFINDLLSRIGLSSVFTQHTIRKCAHFAEFFVLGMVLCFTIKSYNFRIKKVILSTAFISLLIASVDECLQFFSPGRAPQLRDVLIDFSGGLSGLAVSFIFIVLINRCRIRKELI